MREEAKRGSKKKLFRSFLILSDNENHSRDPENLYFYNNYVACVCFLLEWYVKHPREICKTNTLLRTKKFWWSLKQWEGIWNSIWHSFGIQVGRSIGLASVRRCWKFPLSPTEQIPASSKMDPLLAYTNPLVMVAAPPG